MSTLVLAVISSHVSTLLLTVSVLGVKVEAVCLSGQACDGAQGRLESLGTWTWSLSSEVLPVTLEASREQSETPRD